MATPKSTKERLYRHTRPPKATPRKKDMYGRILRKKTGNNDPHRGGNPRLHNEIGKDENLKENLQLLTQLVRAKENSEPISDEKKAVLLHLVEHMIAVSLGGWKKKEDNLVNESGRIASEKNWSLTEDGKLKLRNGKRFCFDVDWLLDVKRFCE